MLRKTGVTEDGLSFFEYRPSFTSGIVRIEWQGDIVAIPTDAAKAVITRNHARNLTDIEVAAWNDAVDKAEDSGKKEPEKPAENKPPVEPAKEPAKSAVALGEEKPDAPKLTPEQEELLKKAEEAATAGKKPATAE